MKLSRRECQGRMMSSIIIVERRNSICREFPRIYEQSIGTNTIIPCREDEKQKEYEEEQFRRRFE
jgi:hypothetical protein